MLCGNTCIDIADDSDNCGSCGNVCQAPTDGLVYCNNNQCEQVCGEHSLLCGNNCVYNDEKNCGRCVLV